MLLGLLLAAAPLVKVDIIFTPREAFDIIRKDIKNIQEDIIPLAKKVYETAEKITENVVEDVKEVAIKTLDSANFTSSPERHKEKKSKYRPRLDSTLRWTYGESLGIQGSLIGVLPVWNDDKNAFFLQPELILWEGVAGQKRQDAGLGLVYRTVLNEDMIASGFVFYDYDFKRGHRRINAGADLQSEIMHASVNYYHPLTSWRKGREGYEERAQKGVEANVGVAIDELYLTGKAGLWKNRTGWDNSYGIEASYEIAPGVFLEAEYEDHDSVGSEWSAGLGFRYSIPDFVGASQNKSIGRIDINEPVERETRIVYEERKFELKPITPTGTDVCPPGTREETINGVLECIKVIPPTEVCEDGELDENGRCVKVIPPTEVCEDGKLDENGRCVKVIPPTEVCEDGKLDENGRCVKVIPPTEVCEDGELDKNGRCVKVIPPTEVCERGELMDGKCIITIPPTRICSDGSQPNAQGECPITIIDVPDCPPNSSPTGNAKECVCDQGYKLNEAKDACVMPPTIPPSRGNHMCGVPLTYNDKHRTLKPGLHFYYRYGPSPYGYHKIANFPSEPLRRKDSNEHEKLDVYTSANGRHFTDHRFENYSATLCSTIILGYKGNSDVEVEIEVTEGAPYVICRNCGIPLTITGDRQYIDVWINGNDYVYVPLPEQRVTLVARADNGDVATLSWYISNGK